MVQKNDVDSYTIRQVHQLIKKIRETPKLEAFYEYEDKEIPVEINHRHTHITGDQCFCKAVEGLQGF